MLDVLACEPSADGWRGINAEGEILNVTGPNGKAAIPAEFAPPRPGIVDSYLAHFNRALELYRWNENDDALAEIDRALALADTIRARYNRALILLALGRWREGLTEYIEIERTSPAFMRPNACLALARGMKFWRGENLVGQRLVLAHDHGFGDTIMALRYVPELRSRGIDVALMVPQRLVPLAYQLGPVTNNFEGAQWFCPALSVLGALDVTPCSVIDAPYLAADPRLVERWQRRLGRDGRRERVGVAWSVGYKVPGDFPRAAPLALFAKTFCDAELVSVQAQGRAEADLYGVHNFEFEDFADCAAVMSLCDRIVTVDTAAVHLAGAIGHPRVQLMLSFWHSWRWQAQWYRNVVAYPQQAPDDWNSVFAMLK